MKLLKLLPQDKLFNDTMWQMAQLAHQSCQDLHALLLANTEVDRGRISQEIVASKNKSKAALESMITALCHSFITPFDREDMQALAVTLYKIPKKANKIKSRLLVNDSKQYDEDFLLLLTVTLEQGAALERMVEDFNKHRMQAVHQAAQQIHELEDKSEEMLAQKIAELSNKCGDVKEFILIKDIFDMVGKMTALFRDSADLALRIIMKHS